MANYYRIDNPADVRDIGDQIAAWIDGGNPKASAWAKQPPPPSSAAEWVGGQWILPPPPPPPATVTARQIRLWLVQHGIGLAAVDVAIDAIPDAITRDSVRVEWEYAPYIERSHPWLAPLASALGLTEAQVDQAFREAAGL